MTSRPRRLMLAFTVVPVFALTLAGCTETVDPKSAENLIKNQIGKIGPLSASSVSCPDGVEKKAGKTFDCKVTLTNTSNQSTGKGTITLHITDGGKRAVFGASDIHVQ